MPSTSAPYPHHDGDPRTARCPGTHASMVHRRASFVPNLCRQLHDIASTRRPGTWIAFSHRSSPWSPCDGP
nr:hypothetical protein CFP56_11030 [Quercus suber]